MKTASTVALALAGLGAAAAAMSLAHCSQTPISVPVRTFERAGTMDVVCMRVLDDQGRALAPVPTREVACAPVPSGVDGTWLPFHLYALVTQTARGEVAVVDLTAGVIIDADHSTPGINFLPVGALPTSIAVTPDGALTFVASGDATKPAVYALRSSRILGDSQGISGSTVPTLPSWPVCLLPERPVSVTVVPRADAKTSTPAVAADAGTQPADAGDAGEAGAAAGSDSGASVPAYDVVVVLQADGDRPGKVVVLDAAPFLRGAGLDTSAGPTVAPGSLSPCPVTSAVALLGDVPAVSSSVPWDDGVKYVDGGVDLSAAGPLLPASCAAAAADAGANADGGADAGPVSAASKPAPRAATAVRDGTLLYVADAALPLVHVIDLSVPGAPVERAPLVATSIKDPSREVVVGSLAVSPPTHEYRKYLYAADQRDGSLMVFDVTAAPTEPRAPMRRPHPELNPFQPTDRLGFSAPVAAVSFVRNDLPLGKENGAPIVAAGMGLLCNPNPNAGPDQGPYVDRGAAYRASAQNADVGLGPTRLRGIFAFATLTNGLIVPVDVDDWDAPCRRPDPMTKETQLSPLGPPEPSATSASDVDPYHTPVAYKPGDTLSPVSLEAFFPVVRPHQTRSAYMLRNDPQTGEHIPYLVGFPQLYSVNASLPTMGPEAAKNPLLRPPSTPYADPSYAKNPSEPNPQNRSYDRDRKYSLPDTTTPPSVRFSWEDPLAHYDQDWTITYEGALPGFQGVVGNLDVSPGDAYQTIVLSNPTAHFCRRGVHDARIGRQRAQQALSAFDANTIPRPTDLDRRVSDYVEVIDEILPDSDPYWQEPSDCWDPAVSTPALRHQFCGDLYKGAADEIVQRDFPVLEAYDDHLVLGRFGYTDATPRVQNRQFVAKDPSNTPFLRAMRCCFHRQVTFRVRTGSEWSAVGSQVGYLHHVTASSDGSCTLSCDPSDQLLNARALELPQVTRGANDPIPDRNSPLALRNPMFAFLMWSGAAPTGRDYTTTARDLAWRFSTRGQFIPLALNLGARTISVSPQSMRFIDSLGQLAIVDGASQGLTLVDLLRVSFARDQPYF